MNLFDQIYVINLPSRPDRKSEMLEQFSAIGLEVDGTRVQFFEAVRPENSGGFSGIGARGCFLSHLGVLKDASSKGLRRLAIIEDDLNFCNDFLDAFAGVENSLAQTPWAIFYGGYRIEEGLGKSVSHSLLQIDSAIAVQTTHFVAFQGEAIPRLVGYLEEMLARKPGDPAGGPMHVDGAYSWFRRDNPDLITILSRRELGYQRPSRTDIHDLKWFDRIAWLAPMVGLGRKVKRFLK